ncbi:MAG: TonB-dependent receptor, partial [Vicinamibacterales bacterium]
FGATSFVGVIHVVHTAAAATSRYASLYGGNYGTGGLAVDVPVPTGASWKSRLSADFDRQGFKDDRTSFGRGHVLWRTAKTDGDNRTWFMADLNILRQDPASPHPRQGTSLSPLVPIDANHNPEGAFLNQNRFAVSYGSERSIGTDKRLGITASFSHTGNDNFRGYLAEVAPGPDNAVGFRQKIDQTDLYVDAHLAWPERHNVRFVAGADWLHGNGDSKGEVFDYTVPLSGIVATSVTQPTDLPIGSDDRRDFFGGYGLVEWRPTTKVTVSGGLRLNITNEEREEGEEEGAAPKDEGQDTQTNVRPSGSVGVLVSLWEQGTNHVRAFANYRNTFKPAVFDFGLGEGEEEGGLLDPETSQSLEGGVKARMMDGQVDFEASVFRMNFTNLVTSTVVNGLPALLNAGETRFQGLELATDVRMRNHVSGRATYSFHNARFVDFAQSFDGVVTQLAGNRFEMSPRHLFTVGGFYTPAEGVFGSIVIKYTGDRYMDKRNRALADAFTTLDIGVGYRFDRYELRLDGRNLTDARDVISESEVGDAQYYRMTAREARLTFGIRF